MKRAEKNEPIELAEADVRAVVRLLADVAVTSGGVQAQRRRLMDGLLDLVDADYWIWNITRLVPDEVPFALSLLHNLSEPRFAKIVEGNYNGTFDDFNVGLANMVATGQHKTRRLDQLLPSGGFEQSPTIRYSRECLDFSGHAVFSSIPVDLDQRIYSMFGMHRRIGKAPIPQRLTRLVHIVFAEVPWLHAIEVPGVKANDIETLSPRQQTVVTLLVEGLAPKRIAYQLDLSEHTVRGYIKDIYRHFNVDGRIELMKRFALGDGGDLP